MNAMLRERDEAPVLTNEAIEVHLSYLRTGVDATQAGLVTLRDKVDVVSERVTRIEVLQQTAIEKIDGANDDRIAGDTVLGEKTDKVETSLTARIDKVETSLNARIDQVETSLTARIDKVESSLNARIDEVETSLGARIDKVETSLNARIDQVETSLTARIDKVEISLNARIDEVETSLGARIDKVETSLNARIDEVETSLGARIDKVESSLNARIDQVETSLGARIDRANEDRAAGDAALGEKIDKLAGEVLQNSKDLSSIKGYLRTQVWVLGTGGGGGLALWAAKTLGWI